MATRGLLLLLLALCPHAFAAPDPRFVIGHLERNCRSELGGLVAQQHPTLSSRAVVWDNGHYENWFRFLMGNAISTNRYPQATALTTREFVNITRESEYPHVRVLGPGWGDAGPLWPEEIEIVTIRADLRQSKLPATTMVDRQRFHVAPTLTHPNSGSANTAAAVENTERALNYLYREAYAHQGDERANEIPTYQQQDLANSDRTTHFLLLVRGEVVGHFQVQTAIGDEDLNLEQNVGRVERDREQLATELGRLILRRRQALSPALQKVFSDDPAFRDLLRHKLYQLAYSYLNWDLDPAYVYGQATHDKTESVYTLPDSPVTFHRLEVRPTKYGSEDILGVTREARLHDEEIHMKAVLKAHLQRFLSGKGEEEKILTMTFTRNERAVLVRLGLVQLNGESTAEKRDLSRQSAESHSLWLASSDFFRGLVDQWERGFPRGGMTTLLRDSGLKDFLFGAREQDFYQTPYLELSFSPAAARRALEILR